MSWLQDKALLQEEARANHSQAVIMSKDGWQWKVLSVVLRPIMTKEIFLKRLATTIGPYVGIPKEWSTTKALDILPHEVAGHVNQFAKAGFGSALLGIIPIGIIYLLLLPILFNPFRFYLERDAEIKQWKWMKKRRKADQILRRADFFAKVLASWTYGKCWPLSWAKKSLSKAANAVLSTY